MRFVARRARRRRNGASSIRVENSPATKPTIEAHTCNRNHATIDKITRMSLEHSIRGSNHDRRHFLSTAAATFAEHTYDRRYFGITPREAHSLVRMGPESLCNRPARRTLAASRIRHSIPHEDDLSSSGVVACVQALHGRPRAIPGRSVIPLGDCVSFPPHSQLLVAVTRFVYFWFLLILCSRQGGLHDRRRRANGSALRTTRREPRSESS
jgi:hypothetical protein